VLRASNVPVNETWEPATASEDVLTAAATVTPEPTAVVLNEPVNDWRITLIRTVEGSGRVAMGSNPPHCVDVIELSTSATTTPVRANELPMGNVQLSGAVMVGA